MTTRKREACKLTSADCTFCGTSFKAYRSSAKYCSEACKQRAKREREFSKASIQEQLKLAKLERDIWEKACKAAIQVLGK